MISDSGLRDHKENIQERNRFTLKLCNMCDYMYVGRQSETAFENTQWKKIKQMQPVHLCIRSGKRFHLSCKTCRKRIIIRIKIHDHMNKIHNRHTVVKSILSVIHVETNTPKLNF